MNNFSSKVGKTIVEVFKIQETVTNVATDIESGSYHTEYITTFGTAEAIAR